MCDIPEWFVLASKSWLLLFFWNDVIKNPQRNTKTSEQYRNGLVSRTSSDKHERVAPLNTSSAVVQIYITIKRIIHMLFFSFTWCTVNAQKEEKTKLFNFHFIPFHFIWTGESMKPKYTRHTVNLLTWKRHYKYAAYSLLELKCLCQQQIEQIQSPIFKFYIHFKHIFDWCFVQNIHLQCFCSSQRTYLIISSLHTVGYWTQNVFRNNSSKWICFDVLG